MRSLQAKLIAVAEKGNLKKVKKLVEQGANIHAWGNEALLEAAENGHLDVVKYLVEQGADIHAKEDYSFYWANYYGHSEVVKYLESVTAKNKNSTQLENNSFSRKVDKIYNITITKDGKEMVLTQKEVEQILKLLKSI